MRSPLTTSNLATSSTWLLDLNKYVALTYRLISASSSTVARHGLTKDLCTRNVYVFGNNAQKHHFFAISSRRQSVLVAKKSGKNFASIAAEILPHIAPSKVVNPLFACAVHKRAIDFVESIDLWLCCLICHPVATTNQ